LDFGGISLFFVQKLLHSSLNCDKIAFVTKKIRLFTKGLLVAGIVTIAKEAKTSVATVSRVLNNKGGVSDALRKRVYEIVEGKGLSVRSLVDRATNIAVIIQTLSPVIEGFCAAVLEGVSTYSFEKNIDSTTIFLPLETIDTKGVIQKIRDNQCDGVLLIFPQFAQSLIAELASLDIPTILVDSQTDIPGIGFVDNDSYNGMYTGVKFLIDLGHKKIGFLCDELEGSDHAQRLSGYRKALADSGIKADPGWVIYHTPTHRAMEAGSMQAKKLMAHFKDITAVVANNDEKAVGAINGLLEMGYKVPEDISVIGFDDLPISRYYNPPLTTIRQPIVEMGYRSARYLDLYSKGGLKELPKEILPTELLVRRSTAPPAK
jgi:DNA-binding LacI/PurR family transcriptional regulator